MMDCARRRDCSPSVTPRGTPNPTPRGDSASPSLADLQNIEFSLQEFSTRLNAVEVLLGKQQAVARQLQTILNSQQNVIEHHMNQVGRAVGEVPTRSAMISDNDFNQKVRTSVSQQVETLLAPHIEEMHRLHDRENLRIVARMPVVEDNVDGEPHALEAVKSLEANFNQLELRVSVVENKMLSHEKKHDTQEETQQALVPTSGDVALRFEALELRISNLQTQTAKMQEEEGLRRQATKTTAREIGVYHADIEYRVGATVWDSCLFVWRAEIDRLSSVVLSFVILLNLIIQASFCIIVNTSEDFHASELYTKMLEHMEAWRDTDGHDPRLTSLGDETLVSRVCRGDDSLSFASVQLEELNRIESYLNLGPEDFKLNQIADGPALGLFCMGIFVLCIMRDLRRMSCFVICVSTMPHHWFHGSQFRQNKLMALSWYRFFFVLFMSLLRLAICVSLLYTGLIWLSATTSKVDLVLNAAALSFITEIDELLFDCLVPSAVGDFAYSIEPLMYTKPLCHIDAIMPGVLTAVILTTVSLVYTAPTMERLLDIKKALCAGHQSFIVGFNDRLGIPVSRVAPVLGKVSEFHSSVKSVNELRLSPTSLTKSTPEHSVWVDTNYWRFEDMTRATIIEAAAFINFGCLDLDEDGVQERYAGYYHRIRSFNGRHSGVSLSDRPFKCSEYSDFCDKERARNAVLRIICPVTCGCQDPLSGMVFARSNLGCPTRCREMHKAAIEEQRCVDVDVKNSSSEVFKGFKRFWDTVVEAEGPHMQDFASAMLTEGCGAASLPQFAGLAPFFNACNDTSFLKEQGMETIFGFCPSYCCKGHMFEGCPKSCS